MTIPDTRSEVQEDTSTGTREQIRQARDKVVDQAKETFRDARDKAGSSMADGRRRAAEQLAGLGTAFHRTSDTLRGEDQARIADMTDTVGQRLDRVSDYLRDSDGRTMMRDLEGLAQRQPALVFAGAFALGIIAARFLKSSDSRAQESFDSVSRGSFDSSPRESFDSSARDSFDSGARESFDSSSRSGYNPGGFDATA